MVTFDLVAVLLLCLLLLGVQRASAARTYRGTRVISCPATGQAAAVELAVWRGALHSLQVRECSRWPAERQCDQACLRQIAAAPADSLIPAILNRWYRDRTCVCCGSPLNKVSEGREPWLMSAEQKMIDWHEIPPQKIPQALATTGPVCWTCRTAETHSW